VQVALDAAEFGGGGVDRVGAGLGQGFDSLGQGGVVFTFR
jgi:hypothetical protein